MYYKKKYKDWYNYNFDYYNYPNYGNYGNNFNIDNEKNNKKNHYLMLFLIAIASNIITHLILNK